jgi:ABC-type nitrate/sulfonate/bicarbonate transport system substrate-binding protein
MSRPLRICRVLAIWLSCVSTATGHDAQAAEKFAKPAVKVRISQSAVSARSTILWSAQELGLFAKHGVDAEVVYLRSSPIQMTALGTGEVQFAASGGSPVLGAAAAGQDIKIIARPSNRLSYALVVRPEIKEAKDLRGKRFGITSIGGTVWMAAYLALEHLGLDASRDQIRINAIGNRAKVEDIIDNRIVRKLDESGFIDGLYRKS